MVYQKYANPRDLFSMYIDSGQFDELVKNILTAEYERRKEEAEKENDRKLWEMFIHSDTTKSYNEWHAEIIKRAKESLDENYPRNRKSLYAPHRSAHGLKGIY